MSKLKNTISNFQREDSTATSDLDIDEDLTKEENNKKKNKTNG